MSSPQLPGITPEAEFVTVKIPDNPTQSDVARAVDALMGYPAKFPLFVPIVPIVEDFSSRSPAVFGELVGDNNPYHGDLEVFWALGWYGEANKPLK